MCRAPARPISTPIRPSVRPDRRAIGNVLFQIKVLDRAGYIDGGVAEHNATTQCSCQIFTDRSLSALLTTDRDDALIANAAKIGPIRMPKNGNRIPAAIGTPTPL